MVNRYLYTDSWGNFKLSCPSVNKGKPCIPNRYIYTGREWDADLDLYFYRARWYDPDTKRFTQEDPVFVSTNRYMYVGNRPIKYSDPFGLQSYPNPMGEVENAWNMVIETPGIIISKVSDSMSNLAHAIKKNVDLDSLLEGVSKAAQNSTGAVAEKAGVFATLTGFLIVYADGARAFLSRDAASTLDTNKDGKISDDEWKSFVDKELTKKDKNKLPENESSGKEADKNQQCPIGSSPK